LPVQDTYFRSSRLHYIGSWKARVEALAESVLAGAPRPQPPPRGGARAIIHCDMDCFFATVAGARRPVASFGHACALGLLLCDRGGYARPVASLGLHLVHNVGT
jgi:hypothetical protein